MKLCAAIQAGGQSRRMGADKAWIAINGQPLIEHVLAAAQPIAHRLTIVISHTTREPERYQALARQWHAALLVDPHDQRGPLGGIETALRACAPDESALILACDLPFLTPAFLHCLCAKAAQPVPPHTPQITVPEDQTGRLQMLCGIYDAGCLPFVERLLAEDQLRVNQLCAYVSTQRLTWAEYAHLPHAASLMMNCNTPEDLFLT